MAGQPRKRAMIAEIERRTREHFEDKTSTHLDYVCAWVQSGKTQLRLADAISAQVGFEVMRAQVRQYLGDTFGEDVVRSRFRQARAEGAHGMSDAALDIADEPVADAADASRQRSRIGARQWVAERWGREDYGKASDAPNVVVNLGLMHVDALRARASTSLARVSEQETHVIPSKSATADATGVVIEHANDIAQVL